MRLVLLGDPVAHSRSPAIHNAALAAVGIEGRYTARPVDEHGVYRAVAEVRSGSLHGANVTMPHKGVAAAAVDRLTPLAARAQAVNTLVRGEDGAVVGHNTDIAGARHASEWAQLPDGPVLILGAGGAAAAAVLAFEGRPIHVSARSPAKVEALLARTGVDGVMVPWGTAIKGAVLVNATPLGMEGESLPRPLLDAASGLLDMAYRTEATLAVVALRTLGLRVADGLDMLVGQAATAFELWTGLAAPLESMREAAKTSS